MARFFRRGKTRVWYIPAMAGAAPDADEINTDGDELTGEIAELNGFSFANQPIPVPDLASEFTGQIGGEDQAEDSSIVFYLDDTSNPLLTTLAKGTAGFIIISDNPGTGNIAASDKVDVWPAVVTATPKEYSTGNDPARWTAQFSITDPPKINVSVLA